MKQTKTSNQGRGYFRKSKAFGLVSGIALAAALLSAGSVSADEVATPKTTSTDTVVTSAFVDGESVKIIDEKVEVAKASVGAENGKTSGVPVGTVVDWESGKVTIPADRPETKSLVVTTPVDNTEVVNIEKTAAESAKKGWDTVAKDGSIDFTLKPELKDKLNVKHYVSTKGTGSMNVEAVSTNHLKDGKETRPVVVEEEYKATRLEERTVEYDEKVTKTIEVEEIETFTDKVTEIVYEDQVEEYTETVKKTREVPTTETVTRTERVPVTKTRQVEKEVEEQVLDYKEQPLALGYIFDRSGSRTAFLDITSNGLRKFKSTLDKDKVTFLVEDYDGVGSEVADYIGTDLTLSIPENGNLAYHWVHKTGNNGLDRVNEIARYLKQQRPESSTVVVIESDFIDVALGTEYNDVLSVHYVEAFLNNTDWSKLEPNTKVLLLADDKIIQKHLSADIVEKIKDKVWLVSTTDSNNQMLDRQIILDKFMTEVVEKTTVKKKVLVDEEYTDYEEREVTEEVAGVRIEEYQDTVVKTRTIQVPKEVEREVELTRVIKVPKQIQVIEKRTKTIQVPVDFTATRKVTVNQEFDIKVPYSVVEPIEISVNPGAGVVVSKVTVTKDGKEVAKLDLVNGKAVFEPKEAGIYTVVYDFNHDGMKASDLHLLAKTSDFETGKVLKEFTASESFEENSYYKPAELDLPLVVSKLTAQGVEYTRQFDVVVNKGQEDQYNIRVKSNSVTTAANVVKDSKPNNGTQTLSQKTVKTLPETGEADSAIVLAAGSVLSGLGLVGLRKKDEE